MFESGFKSQYIGGQKEKFVRLDDLNSSLSFRSDMAGKNRCGFSLEGLTAPGRNKNSGSKSLRVGFQRGSEGLITLGRSLKSGVTKAVFPEDLKVSDRKIFDPQDKSLLLWNKLLVISCIFAVSIDPLFLYLPVFEDDQMCLHIQNSLAYTTTTLRTIIDAFYIVRMVLQFRTAYIAPSSRVFGRGELVIDPKEIASRYLHRYFFVDLFSVLPLPQIVVWRFLNGSRGSDVMGTKQALVIIVFLQYIPRFVRFLPLTSELKKTAGVFAETAWAGAAYYLLWFMLASHIVGALWYLLAIERKGACWDEACRESGSCNPNFLYCSDGVSNMTEWINNSKAILDPKCAVTDDETPQFKYGIYAQALSSGILGSQHFVSKYFYCLWWGLQNLSTLGQGLQTSTYPGEVLFSIAVAIFGLLLFALLIGNMQTYLQSLTVRLEEMRIKRRDSEQWMHHRVLPQELRERVRRYDQYKWLETRGVDEESLVQNLPKDLRRDIKRHLCLNLVRRVPLFANMDDRLLDAICERLKPSLYTEKTYILREGDPVDEMLFIIRGRLESVTTDGGRSGFFNRGFLKEGDFCGEELLTWALDPKSGANFPPSTRTVKALTEVEAFALIADELKFITSQFRRIHSRQVQHTFRFYSQQWRTWAATFIQATWRRYWRRKMAELHRHETDDESSIEEYDDDEDEQEEEEAAAKIRLISRTTSGLGATMLASRFAANALRGVRRSRESKSSRMIKLQKPPEPDFAVE
ncbi:putative cyclic nucleotide-gated ion channel 7 [Primulina eburnea]|uniref:putative cyclic nucleotide-gated ion channel 7 n=1 Tax=Primulina eburnea TaxID=1245227 RepID=UPI003C6C4482